MSVKNGIGGRGKYNKKSGGRDMNEHTRQLYHQGLLSDDMVQYLENQARMEYEEGLYERESFREPEFESYGDEPLTDEEIAEYEDEQYKKNLNLTRDEKGRLGKKATIAKKRNCDEEDIWFLYDMGHCTVSEIVALRGCSKSTVYKVIKKHKEVLASENGGSQFPIL